jgi:hypothetical protein
MKRHRLLLSICGIIFTAGLALASGRWLPPVFANVTLVGFTATYLPGQQAMRIDWETATELDTAGFYVARGNSFTGPFAQVSPYMPHEGDTVVGATYVFTDRIPAVNQTYYYRLEVIDTDQSINYHGPITATASVPATNTFTPTSTRPPTFTPTRTPTSTPSATPTATPTTRPGTDDAAPSTTSSRRIEATPRIPTGSTVTPQPTFASRPASPVAFPATPTLAAAPANSQPEAPPATSVTPLSNVSPLATAEPPFPAATHIVQASALAFAEATPGVVAPVVVATESSDATTPAASTLGEALLLIVAASLFLGIAFVILRQVRQ